MVAAFGVVTTAASAQTASGTVYLSFDDGPSQYTPRILAILDQYGVHATFFELGEYVATSPGLTRQVYAQGDSVQNHTWSHPDLRHVTASVFATQVRSTDAVIRAQTGYTPLCLRPPYEEVNASVYARAEALGKQIRLWTVDPQDWARPGTLAIEHRVLGKVKSGSIILLHDGGGNRSQTVAALPAILSTLQARGYAFATMWC
jgi:peptidoglycan/xylan/chitin deacetylase (PgdA/CDA1 family)